MGVVRVKPMAYRVHSPFLLFGLVEILSWGVYSISTLFLLLHIGEGVMKGEEATLCLPNESLTLLQFKQSLSQGSQPLLGTWKKESDCCWWEGIFCDYTTGFVIELDIPNLGLQVSDPNSSLFQLSHLQSLELSGNSVTGLNLSRLSELTDLTQIRLSNCNLSGPIPESFKQLSSLTYLDLSGNGLSGEIPLGIVKHPNLQRLSLGNNKLNGCFPDFGNEFSQLIVVDLSYNKLDGEIPPSIIRKLPHVEVFHIEGNRFSGTIDFSLFQNMRNLSYLDLSWNNLTVEFPKTVYVNNQATTFPDLRDIHLKSGNIKGEFPWFLQNIKALEVLELSHNNISGKVPTWVWRMPELWWLDLSHNKLDGFEEPVNINGSRNLDLTLSLFMSNNNIKGTIPSALFCDRLQLQRLDLSGNNLTGTIPDCLANLTRLSDLVLSKNQLQGRIPRRLICGFPSLSIVELSDNQFTGEMTRLLYNCSNNYMSILDLSNNRFTGSLPNNWPTDFDDLEVLDLSNNQLQGPIPKEFSNSNTPALQALYLNDNKLVGRIPRNLSLCSQLKVINLGNNELSDVFPFWFGHLDQLRVLALHSNKLHGSISYPFSMHMFSSLLILDISGNKLEGHLPCVLFQNFSSMMKKQTNDIFKDPSALQNTTTRWPTLLLTIKGQSRVWKMITIMTAIDLSNNLFTGGIPEDIGALKELILLNLSRNNLDGPIPRSFGQLQKMESLDLSHNQLSGCIPEELTHDTFLSTMDLSYNNLQGRIPRCTQFDTFNGTYFDGNPGLCGPPLPIPCPSTNRGPQDSVDHVKEMAQDPHWEYLAAGIGYAVGFLTTILPILFIQKVGTWFCVHVDRAFETCINIPTLSSIFCRP